MNYPAEQESGDMKRWKTMIKIKKQSDLEKERDLLNAEILNMKNEIMTMESIKIENLENWEKLTALFDKGVIDETEEYIEKYQDI